MPLEQALALHDSRLTSLKAQLAGLLADRSRITLEIGSGHGHFLTAYAQHHPERFCVGIDLLQDRLARSKRKSERARLTNLAWVHAEARLFLKALSTFETQASTARPRVNIDEVFVLFPDPWPKRRHWKNRIVQPEFLDELAAAAVEGARLFFRTDHAPYFDAAVATLQNHPSWEVRQDVPWPFELTTVFQQRAESYQSSVAVRRVRP